MLVKVILKPMLLYSSHMSTFGLLPDRLTRCFVPLSIVFPPFSVIVQCMQYYYQMGCLYKLRALGERPSMDITVGEFLSIHGS